MQHYVNFGVVFSKCVQIPDFGMTLFCILSGMRTISCSWGFGVPIDLKLSCLHQCCPVIACTLGFLLQLPMLRQPIAGSLSSIIRGKILHILLLIRQYATAHSWFYKFQGKSIRVCDTSGKICEISLSYKSLCGYAVSHAF